LTIYPKNYSQLIALGATINDPIGILFEAYKVVPCHNFKTYMNRMHEDYLDGKLATLFNYLKNEDTWGAKSLDDDKIVAMAAAIYKLKG
jgi:hypothetical protein